MFQPLIDTETTKRISEILRRVDVLVKAEELDRAQAEIVGARSLDPRNIYAHAYSERIKLLIEQRNRNREAAEAKQFAENAGRLKREQELKSVEDQKRKETQRNQPEQQLSGTHHLEEITSYNRALFEAWQSGTPSVRSEQYLATFKRTNHISAEEHEQLEDAVRRECYVQRFRKLWQEEGQIANGPETISDLRKQYRIDLEEFDTIEIELLQQLKRPPAGPVVLVIDDDDEFRKAITRLLEESGFVVRPFDTSEEAYQFLLHSTPDIILADINLETSTIGGFALFERVQQLPRLSHVPFVFVSGLVDDIVIRAGKELGADDYICKPFDNGKLLAVIKGKIRRYNELRGLSRN